MSQRLALASLALVILLGDAFLDLRTVGPEPAWVVAVCLRTALLLVTILALLRPHRVLVRLSLIGVLMALVRRGLYISPLLPNLAQNDFLLQSLLAGLDLAFRIALLGWGFHWLKTLGKEE